MLRPQRLADPYAIAWQRAEAYMSETSPTIADTPAVIHINDTDEMSRRSR